MIKNLLIMFWIKNSYNYFLLVSYICVFLIDRNPVPEARSPWPPQRPDQLDLTWPAPSPPGFTPPASPCLLARFAPRRSQDPLPPCCHVPPLPLQVPPPSTLHRAKSLHRAPVAVDAKSNDHRAWNSPSTTTNTSGFAKYTTGKTTTLKRQGRLCFAASLDRQVPQDTSTTTTVVRQVPSSARHVRIPMTCTTTVALGFVKFLYDPCTTTVSLKTWTRQVPLRKRTCATTSTTVAEDPCNGTVKFDYRHVNNYFLYHRRVPLLPTTIVNDYTA